MGRFGAGGRFLQVERSEKILDLGLAVMSVVIPVGDECELIKRQTDRERRLGKAECLPRLLQPLWIERCAIGSGRLTLGDRLVETQPVFRRPPGDRFGARSGRSVTRSQLPIEPLGAGVGDREFPLILRDLATDVCGNLRKRIDQRCLGGGMRNGPIASKEEKAHRRPGRNWRPDPARRPVPTGGTRR